MTTATFYHAGCEVCVSAEEMILNYLDGEKVDINVVHFEKEPDKVPEAEAAGVKSVPALVMNGQVYHINHGASMEEVKNG
ncbi:MAG TPA: thioredoxin family protein [Bacillota bacterium]|nr:thioredoxin family protein [Bacillota bacterium]